MNDINAKPLWPQHEPDFDRLLRVFRREGLPDRVPFIELFADPEIVAAVLGEDTLYPQPGDRERREAILEQRIRFCVTVGYDYVWAYPAINFGRVDIVLHGQDTAERARPVRTWINESQGVIESMSDFEAFAWPTAESVDYYDVEFVSDRLPDGMRVMGTTSGVMEWIVWLMGLAPFSIALYDDPDLVEAMSEKIGSIFAAVYESLCTMPAVGAVFLGDDMGYKQGTFIRPDQMRQYIFPHQKRLAEIAHEHGMPFLLHSCGNLFDVMDDLIDDVGIDGKHSYEDTFLNVIEAKRLWGDRISILGGVDVDMLTRSDEESVRAYTRTVLESCMPGGGYALGTGNSVANYIPVENYLAMLDEGMKVGWY